MEDTINKLRELTGDQEGDFPKGLIFAAGTAKFTYYLPFEYRKKKADGSYTKKTYEKCVVMKFNPFTGEPL